VEPVTSSEDPECSCGCRASAHRPYEPGAPFAHSVHPLPAGVDPSTFGHMTTLPPVRFADLVWCPDGADGVHVLHFFENAAVARKRRDLREAERDLDSTPFYRFRARKRLAARIASLRSFP
jgi:hypothetical protein